MYCVKFPVHTGSAWELRFKDSEWFDDDDELPAALFMVTSQNTVKKRVDETLPNARASNDC